MLTTMVQVNQISAKYVTPDSSQLSSEDDDDDDTNGAINFNNVDSKSSNDDDNVINISGNSVISTNKKSMVADNSSTDNSGTDDDENIHGKIIARQNKVYNLFRRGAPYDKKNFWGKAKSVAMCDPRDHPGMNAMFQIRRADPDPNSHWNENTCPKEYEGTDANISFMLNPVNGYLSEVTYTKVTDWQGKWNINTDNYDQDQVNDQANEELQALAQQGKIPNIHAANSKQLPSSTSSSASSTAKVPGSIRNQTGIKSTISFDNDIVPVLKELAALDLTDEPFNAEKHLSSKNAEIYKQVTLVPTGPDEVCTRAGFGRSGINESPFQDKAPGGKYNGTMLLVLLRGFSHFGKFINNKSGKSSYDPKTHVRRDSVLVLMSRVLVGYFHSLPLEAQTIFGDGVPPGSSNYPTRQGPDPKPKNTTSTKKPSNASKKRAHALQTNGFMGFATKIKTMIKTIQSGRLKNKEMMENCDARKSKCIAENLYVSRLNLETGAPFELSLLAKNIGMHHMLLFVEKDLQKIMHAKMFDISLKKQRLGNKPPASSSSSSSSSIPTRSKATADKDKQRVAVQAAETNITNSLVASLGMSPEQQKRRCDAKAQEVIHLEERQNTRDAKRMAQITALMGADRKPPFSSVDAFIASNPPLQTPLVAAAVTALVTTYSAGVLYQISLMTEAGAFASALDQVDAVQNVEHRMIFEIVLRAALHRYSYPVV